jgi:flagellar hook-associated protein 2
MSSFTVGGLSTGVDYNELIDKMMEAKRAPIRILESKRDDYNDKISAYSELSDKLAALKTAVTNLKTTSSFYQKQVSVNDTTVLEATVSGSASTGNYSIVVTSLASEEKEVHNGTGLTASTDVVNSSGSDKVFQYTYAGTQRSITVPDGTTLDGLKTLINDDTGNPGVTATVVSDGTNYRLILTGGSTGASNTITIDSGTTLDGTGGTVDFTATSFSETKSASDASFSVDGLSITRSTNSISDVIEGMTFTLKKSGASTTVSVTADNDAIKSQIEDFVSAYNEVISFLDTNMAYDKTTNTAGILNGEGTARNIHTSLRNIVSSSVSGLSGDINLLALIGITSNSETGELEINSTTLETKLSSSMDDVAEMFTDASNGIAIQLYDYINQVTSSVDGSIKLREDGLQDVIDNINDNIDAMEYRLDKTEDDLVRKFTALETLVSGFNTIGNFLTNQVNRLA